MQVGKNKIPKVHRTVFGTVPHPIWSLDSDLDFEMWIHPATLYISASGSDYASSWIWICILKPDLDPHFEARFG
jgi:hypothetical protein